MCVHPHPGRSKHIYMYTNNCSARTNQAILFSHFDSKADTLTLVYVFYVFSRNQFLVFVTLTFIPYKMMRCCCWDFMGGRSTRY